MLIRFLYPHFVASLMVVDFYFYSQTSNWIFIVQIKTRIYSLRVTFFDTLDLPNFLFPLNVIRITLCSWHSHCSHVGMLFDHSRACPCLTSVSLRGAEHREASQRRKRAWGSRRWRCRPINNVFIWPFECQLHYLFINNHFRLLTRWICNLWTCMSNLVLFEWYFFYSLRWRRTESAKGCPLLSPRLSQSGNAELIGAKRAILLSAAFADGSHPF